GRGRGWRGLRDRAAEGDQPTEGWGGKVLPGPGSLPMRPLPRSPSRPRTARRVIEAHQEGRGDHLPDHPPAYPSRKGDVVVNLPLSFRALASITPPASLCREAIRRVIEPSWWPT